AYDTLSASSTAFAGELTEAGVPAEHRVVARTPHGLRDRPPSPTAGQTCAPLCRVGGGCSHSPPRSGVW
ncbi:hypothetical protein, partial [Nocardia carnea]|uniref:hypothetical protein n=1 Tax=Nocardia carnea TaxID=37328 RepID=UPI003D7879A8